VQEKYDLFGRLLASLYSNGVLSQIILVGSWCLPLYKKHFHDDPQIPILRTTDIDFLIPLEPKPSITLDLPKILENLGFEKEFSYVDGSFKFIHPDLELEFLTPDSGRPKSKPVHFDNLQMTAVPLRFLSILQEHKIKLSYDKHPRYCSKTGGFCPS